METHWHINVWISHQIKLFQSKTIVDVCYFNHVCTWIIDLFVQADKLCEMGTNNESSAKRSTQEHRLYIISNYHSSDNYHYLF